LKTKLTFGIAFDVADGVIVVAHNAAMTVPVESGYTVRIVPELVEAGVKETKAGIKFPGKGPVSAIILVDPAFREVQVRPLDSAWTRVSLSRLKDSYDEAKIEQLASKIDEDGEIVKLYEAVMDSTTQRLANILLTHFGGMLLKIDNDKLGHELKVLLSDEELLAPAEIAE